METRESALRELTTLKQRIRDIEAALSRQHEESAVPLSSTTASALSAAVPMDATRIVMHQIVAPTEVDALGICTGGQVSTYCPLQTLIDCPVCICMQWEGGGNDQGSHTLCSTLPTYACNH